MEELKYELTNITMDFEGEKLYRIRALKDFNDIKKGDLGGWVSNENNLSQKGNCWIYNNAKCMDSARIYDNVPEIAECTEIVQCTIIVKCTTIV